MGKDGAFIHKIDYVTITLEIFNLKGHSNHIMAILLNRCILPVGEASVEEGLQSTGLPRLVY